MNDQRKWVAGKMFVTVLVMVLAFAVMASNVLASPQLNASALDEQQGGHVAFDTLSSDDEVLSSTDDDSGYLSYGEDAEVFRGSRLAVFRIIFVASDTIGCLNHRDWCCSVFYVQDVTSWCIVDFSQAISHAPHHIIPISGYFRDVRTNSIYHYTDALTVGEPRVFVPYWRNASVYFHANDGALVIGNSEGYCYLNHCTCYSKCTIGVYYFHLCPSIQTIQIREILETWHQPRLSFFIPLEVNGVFVGWIEYDDVKWKNQVTGEIISMECEVYILTHMQFIDGFGSLVDLHFEAIWEPTSITNLTFNANGGAPQTQMLAKTAGSQVRTLPPPPTREGFVFTGWFDAPTGGTQFTTYTIVPDTDTTLWARWEVVLTFINTGGIPATQTITAVPGIRLTDLQPLWPTKHGYIFAGWYNTPEATGGTRITFNMWVPSAPATYWARWVTNVTIYYQNLVCTDSPFARNQADDTINAVKHLFMTNFGVNLVQSSPARHEPGLQVGMSASTLVGINRSNHTTMHFRFVNFSIGPYAGWARPGNGLQGSTGFPLGDMLVTTIVDPIALRFGVVHEIAHLFDARDCWSTGCVMNFSTPRANYSHWCNSCRRRIQNRLGWMWTGHLSHFVPGASVQDFAYFTDTPYCSDFIEPEYFFSPI